MPTILQRRRLLQLDGNSLYTGLNAYWKFGDANDSVNGRHWTLNNTPTFGAAKLGNGMTVTAASSQYASQASNALLMPASGGFTLCGWVNFASVTGLQPILCKYNGGVSADRSYLLNLSTSKFSATIFNQSAVSGGAIHGTTLSTGTWYFFEVTWDLTTVSVNINRGTAVTGTLEGTGMNQSTCPVHMGAYSSYSPSQFASHTLDSVGIWSRALTATELDYLYNSGSGRELY